MTNTDIAPRLGISYDLTGQGRTVLKAFYGRYYNNLADGFSSANPGGTNYAEYDFNDRNGNGRYDGPHELGAERLRIGGATTTVNPDLDTPYTDEISGTLEHQFWGESSARFTYVRKMQRKFVPFYYTPFVPAWFGQLTVPIRVVTDESGKCSTWSTSRRRWPIRATRSSTTSRTAISTTTRSSLLSTSASVAGSSRRAVSIISGATSCARPDIDNWGTTSPLSADPIGVNYFLNPNPAVPNRQETTGYGFAMMGRYVFPRDVGVAANYRFQSGFPYSRIIPDATTTPTLNATPVPFFVEDLKNNRSDNVHLLNFRVDKAFTVGKIKITGMFDIYNAAQREPGDQLQPVQRRLRRHHRRARSARGTGRVPRRVLKPAESKIESPTTAVPGALDALPAFFVRGLV